MSEAPSTRNGFWAAVAAQLTELQTAYTAADVCRILAVEANPYGSTLVAESNADGFFAGSGGDDTVLNSLYVAGWRVVEYEADYHWTAEAPNGDRIEYVEGDIYNLTAREGK
jgi:hypothetical protein